MIQKYALICLAFFAFIANGFGQSIFTNPITGTNPSTTNPYNTGQTVDANITASGIGRGAGIAGAMANDRYNTNSWNTATIDLTAYFEFILTPNAGYEIDFVSFVYTGQASGTGPTSFAFRSSVDGYVANIGTPSAGGTTINLSAANYQNITTPITFRLYGWNTTNAGGTFSINNFTFNGTVNSTLTFDSCLSEDFDDDFGNLPGGFVSPGGANTNPAFYQSAGYSRSLASTQTLRTPAMVRPAAIEFYTIGSGAGGQLLTLDYTNDGTNWFALTTYNVTATGATYYYDSSADTSSEPVAAYRITSGADTIYIDDLTVYCTCDLTASGIADILCNDNGTDAITTDDFITFELDPTVVSSSTVYNVSVSSGTITPNMNINYGSPTTFTLQGGSAGGGDVTVTITDAISGGCELDVVITDPGSCSTGGGSCGGNETFNNSNATTAYLDGSFVGDDGITWTYGHSRNQGTGVDDYSINTNGLMLRRASDSYIEATITGGVGTLSFDYRKAFTGAVDRQLELLVDGIQVSTTPIFGNTAGADATVYNFSYDINQSNDVIIRIKNVGATTTNRQTVIDNIIWTCNTPSPELQLVDADGIDQNCGYTIDFGSQALTTTTDITFDIENIGAIDLIVSSLAISGDFTIVSPLGGFTVTPGNSQEVVVSFTPSADGTRTANLTINNDDANEGTCTVELTGVGFTPAPNIRVERNTEALIANGAAANVGNNTIFATTDLGNTSAPKLYYVRNGNASNPATTDLMVNTIASSNNAEFTLVNVPTLPITLAPSEFIAFEIEFSPNSTTPLTRSSTITVTSSDTTDNPYTFRVEGTAGCPIYNGTISPTSGPVGTEITITSAENLTGAIANLNGEPLTTVSSSVGELVVSVPLTITLGGVLTVTLSNGCSFTNTFTLIDEAIQSCEGSGSAPAGLFISQVTDSPTGSLTYIELYNATGSNINFAATNYSLRVYNNGSTTTFSNIPLTTGIVAQNSTFVVAIGTNDSQCPVAGGNGSLAQLTISTPGVSINFHMSGDLTIGHDYIGLYNSSSTLTDAFGTFGNESWAVGLNLDTSGANFIRNTDATLPTATFSINDWDVIDWENCAGVDYSDIGVYDFSVGTPPSASVLMSPTSDCDLSATLTVTGTEGFNGGSDTQELAYQWYYSAPGDLGWTEVPDNATYDGVDTDTLEILSTLTLDRYQYYCQVREDDATCYTASNAVKVSLAVKTWVGPANGEWYEAANWSPTCVPLATDTVVITSGTPVLTGGIPIPPTQAFAKSLLVQSGATLLVPSGQNLIVEQCIVNNGTITLENTANLVQKHTGTDLNSGNGSFSMQRTVTGVQNYNYIYWSSPVASVDVSTLPGSGTHRYYWNPTATNANSTQGDWISATGEMEKGKGYIIRYSTGNVTSTFTGNGIGHATPHNGDFTVTIEKGTLPGIDDNWNLIGNPYPSAISADTFIMDNAAQIGSEDINPTILGTLYLWQHQGTPNTANDPFYEDFQINYNGDNYIAYNVTGINPPTSQNGFDGYIASGQAFFVLMDQSYVGNTATVAFDNSVRFDIDNTVYENTQFLRQATDNENVTAIERHRLWLDLIAPNNTSVSTLVGYVTGATNDKDHLFDGYETNATGLGFYSMVGYDRMGIQGRALPFVDTDVVPLGVNLLQTGTHTIAINQVDGLFEAGQNIFLEDTYTNTIHNLRATPFTFYSVGGMFNDRFILRYTNETLSIPDVTVDGGLTIIELSNGHIKFTVGHNLTITSVEIYDMLGRQLYSLSGTNAAEIYSLSNLSQAAYVAKVTLSNGQTVTKRAVKRH